MIILAAKGAGIMKCLEEKAGSILTSLLHSGDDFRTSQAGEAPEINHHQENPTTKILALQKCKIFHCARWIPRMIDSLISTSKYLRNVIDFCDFIIFVSKQIHVSVWAGCVTRWWIQKGREGRQISFSGTRRLGRESLCSRVCVTSYTHVHIHLQHKHTHLHVLSLPLWLIVWPPVGSLTSCCPVLWEITSLSSWHARQTVFWLTYAQLLHSSFPAISPPMTACIGKCYWIFGENLTFPISYHHLRNSIGSFMSH